MDDSELYSEIDTPTELNKPFIPSKTPSSIKLEQLTRNFADQFAYADKKLNDSKKELMEFRIAYITAEANYREAQKRLTDAKRKIYTLQVEFDVAITKAKSIDDATASARIRRVTHSRYRSKSCGRSVDKINIKGFMSSSKK